MPENPGDVLTVPPVVGNLAIWAPGTQLVARTIFQPFGTAPADIAFRTALLYTVQTAEVSQDCRALYLGRVGKVFNVATVAMRIITAAVTLDYAEVAICKGTPGVRTNQKLTTLGYTDAISAFQTGGAQTLSVSFAGSVAGDHLWLAWVQKQTQGTFASFSPGTADYITSGMFQNLNPARPSTMLAETQFAMAPDTLAPAWLVVGMGNA